MREGRSMRRSVSHSDTVPTTGSPFSHGRRLGGIQPLFWQALSWKGQDPRVVARREDTPEYVRRMQQELFTCLGEARSLAELRRRKVQAQEIHRRYREGLENAEARELATHRRVSRLSYSRKCAEASAVQAYQKRGISLAPVIEIGCVVRDSKKWIVDPERDASGFDEAYCGKLLDKAWSEVAFVFR